MSLCPPLMMSSASFASWAKTVLTYWSRIWGMLRTVDDVVHLPLRSNQTRQNSSIVSLWGYWPGLGHRPPDDDVVDDCACRLALPDNSCQDACLYTVISKVDIKPSCGWHAARTLVHVVFPTLRPASRDLLAAFSILRHSLDGCFCWLNHLTCKRVPEMTYKVWSGTLGR